MYKLDRPLAGKPGKYTVCDALPPEQVEDLILKYRVVEIYAKVGSGKNYWANSLIRLRNEKLQGLNILL